MNRCLQNYMKCLNEEQPVMWELQCADKIFKCLKTIHTISPKETKNEKV